MSKSESRTQQITDADRRAGFIRATNSFSGAGDRWRDRAATGMSDRDLGEALAAELGIAGGSTGPGCLSIAYQGAGLKIWIAWEIPNPYKTPPTFEGKAAVAMARLVYGIRDPADTQLLLF